MTAPLELDHCVMGFGVDCYGMITTQDYDGQFLTMCSHHHHLEWVARNETDGL